LKIIQSLGYKKRHVTHLADAPFLKVDDLEVRYNGNTALEQVTFELHGGEQVAVVGPNGAGKSTLFKAIAGVLNPSAGQITLSGHEPSGHICIAYLPQRSEVDWSFPVTVKDVVMMGRVGKIGFLRSPGSADWHKVEEALALVRLEPFSQRQISELSGGQQQRMFIAQALAQEAELLMMDEPLSGLDIPSQEEVLRILQELKQRKVTVMVATHDLGQAADRFDLVMLLNHLMLGFGKASSVFTPDNLRHAYGNHLQLIETEDGLLAVGDSCCDG
jgi:manganese/iron transport system ATP-binding protein